MTQIIVKDHEVIAELERLQKPGLKAVMRLEQVLAEVFTMSQTQVHVITGSLRGSGKTASDFDGEQWSGMASYGGPSPGFPNNPVEYAFYEWRRGGAHDFFGQAQLVGSKFSDAIIDGHLES